MISIDMPPSYLRNSDKVGVESFLEGTTAHRARLCPSIRREVTTVTVAQALAFLHAQWCPTCLGRRG